MAGFFDEVRKVGKTPQQIAAEQSAKVAPVAGNDLNSYVKNQVQDIYGRSPESLRASFQAGNQVAPIGQVAAPVNNPAQVVAPVKATADTRTPALAPVRKAAPSPVGKSIAALSDVPQIGADSPLNGIQFPAGMPAGTGTMPGAPVAAIGAAPAETVSSIYNGETNADGTLKAKTFTTKNNPAAGLGKFEGDDEVMMIDGGRRSYTGERVTGAYDPATGKVAVTPIGGIGVRSVPQAEAISEAENIGKQRFVAEGKINAEAAKDIAIGKNQESSAKYTDAELLAGKPAAAVSLIKKEASRAGADAFKTTVEGKQIKEGENPKGKNDKLLQESQSVYEKAHKSYLELVKDSMDETLTPEKKLANAELYATQEARKYVAASVAMKKKKDDKIAIK